MKPLIAIYSMLPNIRGFFDVQSTDENAFEKSLSQYGISALIHQIFQTSILLFISHFQVHGKPLLTFFIMAVLGLPFCF